MSSYQIKKISRGEYQVIRPDGSEYFQFPVSKYRAEQAILDEKVHARFLTAEGIKKAVQRYIMHRGITIGGVGNSFETFIYQYSYRLDHKEMRAMMKRPALFVEHIDNVMERDKAARLSSLPASDDYKYCNHHHELTDDHCMVNFGDGDFVANKAAVPLLAALNEAGLRTRTHHYTGSGNSFVSILLDGISIEVREVNEINSNRDKYNGKMEFVISWQAV